GLVERSARLGAELLERTRSLEASPVVREVRGLGLMWAVEVEEPEGGSRAHRVLSQVAGHGLNVVKALPPLVVTEDDLDWFVPALEDTVTRDEKMPRALVRFALTAGRGGRTPGRRPAAARRSGLRSPPTPVMRDRPARPRPGRPRPTPSGCLARARPGGRGRP